MRIDHFIWLDNIVEKLAYKHQVETQVDEEALRNRPKFRFIEKGDRDGEDVYMALSRTEEGRYLTMLFIYKPALKDKGAEALILSARDMAGKERKLYERK